MAYPVSTFPYYGKLENDDEVYIACIYNPVIFDILSGFTNDSYIYTENNKRLSFLSYLPLQISIIYIFVFFIFLIQIYIYIQR